MRRLPASTLRETSPTSERCQAALPAVGRLPGRPSPIGCFPKPDHTRRFELYRKAERILCEEELPIVPLSFRRGNYLLNSRFTGVNDNMRKLLQIQRAHINK